MGKIASFEEFQKQAGKLAEDDLEMLEPGMSGPESEHGEGEHKYYMFFKNLSSIKHYISEIEKMDPDQLDQMLQNGHDWAADHIATSKDDIQEVADWVRGEMEGQETEPSEPQDVIVNIEGDDDQVEVETEEGEEEKAPESEEEQGGAEDEEDEEEEEED